MLVYCVLCTGTSNDDDDADGHQRTVFFLPLSSEELPCESSSSSVSFLFFDMATN